MKRKFIYLVPSRDRLFYIKKRGTLKANMRTPFCAVDSRLVEPNGIFFALKGNQTDGHLFLEEVSHKGAKKAYVEKDYNGPCFGLELFFVPSPLEMLHSLAKNKLHELQPLTIGITGSFAKTTTKETLADTIQMFAPCYRSYKNANSQTGIPLGILNSYQNEPFAVIEMGIENFTDMDRLVKIVKPRIAIITRIAPAHLETLHTLENIAKEKGKIIDPVETKWVFLHHSVKPYLKFFSLEGKSVIYYGNTQDELFDDLKDLCNKVLDILNLGPIKKIQIPVVENRLEEFHYPKGIVVMDCYNSNPTSMIQFFSATRYQGLERRKIAIIGQMASLGALSNFYHKKIAHELENKMDIGFVVGKGAKILFDELKKAQKRVFYAENIEELKPLLSQHIIPQDLVMVKGSNLNRLWELKPWLQQTMS
ncbi:MAG: hypothetical protein EB053_00330 [Chlamydiae bacterium]|nr:hypothetical protein [Chlamydiota bacterium]